MANPISNLGLIPTLTIAGRVFTDLANLKTFRATVGVTNLYDTFENIYDFTNAKYVVPGGKTLVIYAIQFWGTNSATEYFNLGYGDTSVTNSGSAPTNPVNHNPIYPSIGGTATSSSSTTATNYMELAFGQGIPFPTGKYPYVTDNAAGSCLAILFGYEV